MHFTIVWYPILGNLLKKYFVIDLSNESYDWSLSFPHAHPFVTNKYEVLLTRVVKYYLCSTYDSPPAARGSPPRTSWCRPGAAGQTQCRWDRGSGSLETEMKNVIIIWNKLSKQWRWHNIQLRTKKPCHQVVAELFGAHCSVYKRP